jgi:hypothetical protein
MNKFEVIEKAFEKVNGVIDGKEIWTAIEMEVAEQGYDNGKYEINDVVKINGEYSKVIYEIDVERDYDEEQDLHYTDIGIISIRVDGEPIF